MTEYKVWAYARSAAPNLLHWKISWPRSCARLTVEGT